MITPALLKPGDKVAIVAPAKKLSPAELDAAVGVIRSWGLTVSTGQYVHTEDHSYLSATDERRLADIQEAINDEEIRAIFCVRGGYGSTRIIDQIDFTNLRDSPKWLVGFSDITAVLLAAYNFGVRCIHGTMPVQFGKDNWKPSVENLRKTLFEGAMEMTSPPHPANRPGSGEGILIGGNLSIIADSLATSSEINTRGSILLLEEIDEDLYRLDRMLTHLKRTGKFDNLAGLAIGHMSDLRDTSNYKEGFESMIRDKILNTSYPVGWGLPFGHENYNQAWVVGQPTKIMVDAKGTTLSPTT
ncbi:LD-carboxypeptidase [Chryseolinea sp. T2]|uniref:S66 peptidase family protein n=1 Tax=Chryseolinea sp. T2 TaxID=3129255 RepID=UPI003076B8EC